MLGLVFGCVVVRVHRAVVVLVLGLILVLVLVVVVAVTVLVRVLHTVGMPVRMPVLLSHGVRFGSRTAVALPITRRARPV